MFEVPSNPNHSVSLWWFSLIVDSDFWAPLCLLYEWNVVFCLGEDGETSLQKVKSASVCTGEENPQNERREGKEMYDKEAEFREQKILWGMKTRRGYGLLACGVSCKKD